MLITDRLSKMIVPLATSIMDAETCVEVFLKHWVGHHGLLRSIISDRGTNWVSAFWRRLYELTGIQQKLFTTFYLKIDKGTERVNQEV